MTEKPKNNGEYFTCDECGSKYTTTRGFIKHKCKSKFPLCKKYLDDVFLFHIDDDGKKIMELALSKAFTEGYNVCYELGKEQGKRELVELYEKGMKETADSTLKYINEKDPSWVAGWLTCFTDSVVRLKFRLKKEGKS